ncbi:MAG: hypothetical protein ACSLE1_01890 [Sphingobium sp.]
MGTKKKPIAWILAGFYFLWGFVGQPLWNVNLERLAEKNGADTTLIGFAPLTWLQDFVSYLPSSFAAGFVTGALIFAYWDNVISLVRRTPQQEPEPKRLPDFRAWIGNMWPDFSYENRSIELYMNIINVGDAPFKLKKPQGEVVLRCAQGRHRLTGPRFSSAAEDFHQRG